MQVYFKREKEEGVSLSANSHKNGSNSFLCKTKYMRKVTKTRKKK